MQASVILGAIIFLLDSSPTNSTETNLPPVFLNHFYIALDSATFGDIERSPFLRKKFAVTEKRTTVRSDLSYSGLYFYGRNTYIEFFDVTTQPLPPGYCSIAFGVDQTGGLQAIGRKLSSKISLGEEPITRQYEAKQIPWFYFGELANFSMDSGLAVWIMEYHPSFLAEWNPEPNGQSRGVRRKDILQRYVTVLKDVPASPYFEDVVALTISTTEAEQKRLVEVSKLLGFREHTNGNTKILKGPDIELRLIPQIGKVRGIQEITMRVRGKPKGQAGFRFGSKSVLKFQGNRLAIWSF